MNIKLRGFIAFVCFLTIVSCQKEDDGTNVSQEFYNDGNHVFSYQCDKDNIEFFLDDLLNETNNLEGDWPNTDVYRIYVDYNSNGMLDPDVDLMIGKADDGRVCVVMLQSQNSTSGCSFYDDVLGESLFSATENSAAEHINYKLTVPKSRLSNSSVANVVIHLQDAENGLKEFPKIDSFFSNTLEISW